MKPQEAVDQNTRFGNLRDAVRNLYYSACWTPDRLITRTHFENGVAVQTVLGNEQPWEEVRDAAGFPKDGAPTMKPFDGVRVEYSLSRLRLLGKLIRKAKGDPEFTSDQAEAFLLLHRAELQDRLDKTLRDFLKERL